MKIRYAYNPTTKDRFHVDFRQECERTLFDPLTGKDESLIEVMEKLERHGYLLFNSREDLVKRLEEDKVNF